MGCKWVVLPRKCIASLCARTAAAPDSLHNPQPPLEETKRKKTSWTDRAAAAAKAERAAAEAKAEALPRADAARAGRRRPEFFRQ